MKRLTVLAALLLLVAFVSTASAQVWVDPAPLVVTPRVIGPTYVAPTVPYVGPVVTYPTTFVAPVAVPRPVVRTRIGPLGRVRTTYWGW